MANQTRRVSTVAEDDQTKSADWQRIQQSRRQSEKRSRQRRAHKIDTMRQQIETLCRVHFVLPIVEDPDAAWDDFLDDEQKLARSYLRRLLPASKEIQRLLHEKALLNHLTREHGLMVQTVRALVEDDQIPVVSWKQKVLRWRTLTRVHFRPWTMEQCQLEIEKATNEMNRFILSNDKASSGLSILGWQDSRRFDPSSSRVQFTLTKTLKGYDLDHYVASSWRIYTDASVCSDVVFGGRAKLSFEILQELSPTCCLIRFVESYDNIPSDAHHVYLVACVDTEDGVVQFMRSVCIPEVQRAINQPNDVWAFDFYWMRWDIRDMSKPRTSTDFTVSLGGTMFLENVQYLHYWLFELLGAVVRSEAYSSGRSFLTF